MSVERIMPGEQQEGGSLQAPSGGVAVAEKSTEPNVVISPEEEIPGITTTKKVRELVKPPTNRWRRFLPGSGAQTPEEESVVAEEEIIPGPESEPTTGGAGNGAEDRDGGGGGGEAGGGGQEAEQGEPSGLPEWWPFSQQEWDVFKEAPARRPVVAINYYHNLSNTERAANEVKQKKAYDRAVSYAIQGDLYSTQAEIADLKDELADSDLDIISQYAQQLRKANDRQSAEKIRVLRIKLHDLDTLRTGLKPIEDLDGLAEDIKSRLNLTQQDWQDLAGRGQNYTHQIEDIEKEISLLVGQEFVNDRKGKIAQIQTKEGELRDAEEERKQQAIEEEEGETDQEPQLINEVPDENLPSFADTLDFINTQRGLSEPERDITGLTQADTRLAWYFYKAKELGLTTDLEAATNRVCRDYKELSERVGMQALNNLTRDIDAIRAGLLTDRVWAIRVMTARGLNQFPVGFASKFNGLRQAYLERAGGQIEYQIQKILDPAMPDIQDMIDQGLIERLPGEFNVRDTDLEQTVENRPHYQILYGTMVELTGENEEDVDKGIDEYIDNLLYGSGAFDIQTVYGKMNQLGEAIERASLRLKFKELSPQVSLKEESDYREKYSNKRRQTFNRILFPLTQHSENNLDTENTAGLLKREALRDLDKNGYESYRELIKDPDVFLSMHELYTEFSLYFTPVGHKGQLVNKTPAQYFLREQLRELLIDKVMNQQFRGDANRLTRRMTDLDIKTLFVRREGNLFKGLTLKEALDKAREAFKNATTTQEKRSARDRLKLAKREFYGRQKEVQVKVNLAIAAMDSLGESARLGAPSVIMDNGDYIRMDDMNLAGKFATLEEAKKIGDSQALIRWRKRMWVASWKEAGLDRKEARTIYRERIQKEYRDIDQRAPQFMLDLIEGFEETGYTKGEWQAFQKAWKALRKDGYNAVLAEREEQDEQGNPVKVSIRFEDVLKMDELKPVLNNFISNYAGARETFLNPIAIREAKKGNDPYLLKILKRLDQSGRAKFSDLDIAWEEGKLEHVTPEQLKELFEDAISDTLIFDTTIYTLTRHMATRPRLKDAAGEFIKDNEGNFVYPTDNPLDNDHLDQNNYFTSNNLDYGFPGLTWLFKRLRSLPDYYATNKRERISRGIELMPWISTHLVSLSEYLACDNLTEMIWEFNKGFVDQWVLTTFPEQILSAQTWRGFGETAINEKNEVYFGLFDKILVDADTLLATFTGQPYVNWMEDKKLFADTVKSTKYKSFIESVVKHLEETVGRIKPLDGARERSLGQFRSAAGSNVGRELNELFGLKIAEWLISEKQGDRREQAGIIAYGLVKNIIKFLMLRDTYEKGTSLWEERFGKYTSSRNAGLPTAPPLPVF